ncbi:hypothetical protein V490_05847 [Pseudogymnoascus sp. VKM F-3557]|nr:hypothetical protein V490_05847 [Pseudogymnoascus sp. VKM F-3557]
MGVSYLHSHGVCHGDLHTRNFLLRGSNLDSLSTDELYSRYRLDKAPITRVDDVGRQTRRPNRHGIRYGTSFMVAGIMGVLPRHAK